MKEVIFQELIPSLFLNPAMGGCSEQSSGGFWVPSQAGRAGGEQRCRLGSRSTGTHRPSRCRAPRDAQPPPARSFGLVQ